MTQDLIKQKIDLYFKMNGDIEKSDSFNRQVQMDQANAGMDFAKTLIKFLAVLNTGALFLIPSYLTVIKNMTSSPEIGFIQSFQHLGSDVLPFFLYSIVCLIFCLFSGYFSFSEGAEQAKYVTLMDRCNILMKYNKIVDGIGGYSGKDLQEELDGYRPIEKRKECFMYFWEVLAVIFALMATFLFIIGSFEALALLDIK